MISFGCPTLIELPEVEDTARLCAELGLKFIELNMSFPQYQPERFQPQRLRTLSEKYGIFYTFHIDEELNPCCTNAAVARDYTLTALKAVELAKALGVPTLNMHLLRGVYITLPERRTYIYAENEVLYLSNIRAFRDAVTGAIGESGIKYSIENTDGYSPDFLLHALDTLLESPAFAMTYDIGHDEAIDFKDKPLILARQERLVHMHMHDAAGQRVHLALGDGALELPYYLELAKKQNCRVVLETKTVAALRKSVLWLKERGYM